MNRMSEDVHTSEVMDTTGHVVICQSRAALAASLEIFTFLILARAAPYCMASPRAKVVGYFHLFEASRPLGSMGPYKILLGETFPSVGTTAYAPHHKKVSE